jgi:cyclopropane fatty-acyl-phospholipid synthase-like methyltransferase
MIDSTAKTQIQNIQYIMTNSPSPNNNLFTEMTRRYAEQEIPWNHELPPPEVIALAEILPPGRMLDLGCGLGRACIYLARHGWVCDGVDFVAQAISIAQARAEAAGVSERVQFHVAPITDLDFLVTPYDLILDVGCLHAQSPEDEDAYARHVLRLLKPGGMYVLFAHFTDESNPDARQWTTGARITRLFSHDLTLERVERGTSSIGENTWASAWFWMVKP